MVIRFMRQDKNGRPVEVEVWRDDQTGEFIRIKTITHLEVGEKVVKFRNDFYRDEDVEEFKTVLAQEITYLLDYEKALTDILTPPKQPARRGTAEESCSHQLELVQTLVGTSTGGMKKQTKGQM